MSDETKPENDSTRNKAAGWDDVGRQFQALGDSLAAAFRTAWQDEGNRQKVDEIKNSLGQLGKEIGKAVEESASSDEGQKFLHEVEKAINSLQQATVDSAQEMKPHLVTTLRKIDQEIQKLIEKVEAEGKKSE